MRQWMRAGTAGGFFLFAAGAWPATVQAQEEAKEEAGATEVRAGQLEEIIVLARKRGEDIQNVPISITALSADELQQQSARNVADIGFSVPNLLIQASSTFLTAPTFTIRGQVQNDTTAAIDPSVGLYVDGVYWARAYGSNAALLDVAGVEVLKGPQGTLFGRNTTGGAINIRTKVPELGRYDGSFSLTAASQDQLNFSAIANIPIGNRIAARFAVQRQKNGGWIDNAFTGEKLMDSREWTARGKLLFEPGENTTILLAGDYFKYWGQGPVHKLIYLTPPFDGAGNPVGLAAIEALLESGFTDDASGYVGGDPYTVHSGGDPLNRATTFGFSGTVTQQLGEVEAKLIGAFRRVKPFGRVDDDGTPYQIFDPFGWANIRQWSGELQLSGRLFGDRTDWTAGLYYFDESGYDLQKGFISPLVLGSVPRAGGVDINNRSYAGYAQATHRFNDLFSITAGLRYSSERRRKLQRVEVFDPANPDCLAGLSYDPARNLCTAPFGRTDGAWSYLLSLEFKPAPDLLLYARTARGFRAGGYNSRGGQDLPDGGSFGPETVTDYEIGLKSELFDRRARFNIALFNSEYHDIQSTLLTVDSNNQPLLLVQNAARGRIRGFEAELQVMPVEGLMLSGSLGHTDAKFLEFQDLSGDRSGEAFPLTPKWTASVGAQYIVDTGAGALAVRADYSYKSRITFQRDLHPPFTRAPGYGLVNTRLSLTLPDNGIEIALFARNLFDKTYKTFVLDLESAGLGLISATYGQPRQYGLQVTVPLGGL